MLVADDRGKFEFRHTPEHMSSDIRATGVVAYVFSERLFAPIRSREARLYGYRRNRKSSEHATIIIIRRVGRLCRKLVLYRQTKYFSDRGNEIARPGSAHVPFTANALCKTPSRLPEAPFLPERSQPITKLIALRAVGELAKISVGAKHKSQFNSDRILYAVSPRLMPLIGVRCLALTFAPGILAAALLGSAQDNVPNFKTGATGAFVWGEDNLTGAVSGSIQDPLTGNEIRKISYGGIEVSSSARFELAGLGQSGELVSFTTTLVNSTNSDLFVSHAGARVDGYIALPFPVDLIAQRFSKTHRSKDRELSGLSCLTGGVPASEPLSSPKALPEIIVANPGKSVTISFITKDPRNYSIICSVEGCYPKGATRFFVTVNSTDFVFVWPGRTMAYCGK